MHMPSDLGQPIVLLLHEGGWDEVLMVAAGLGIAYLIIVWTGRKHHDSEDEWKEEADEPGASQHPDATPEGPRERRP
jgi:hypothetical protein